MIKPATALQDQIRLALNDGYFGSNTDSSYHLAVDAANKIDQLLKDRRKLVEALRKCADELATREEVAAARALLRELGELT